MSDYDSGLPIRSEADGTDERVHSKLVDFADPSGTDKQLEISEKKAHARVFGKDSDSADQQLRLSQLGAPNPDGDYDATNNKKPASSGLVAHDRAASIDDTHQNKRVTAVAGSDDTVCLDVALRDEAGQPYGGLNPLPVTFEQSEGTEIHDFDQAVAVVKDASSNHDYSVANGQILQLSEILCSASGKARFELQVGDGAVSEVFATKAVVFNSTANPNAPIIFTQPIIVTGTANTTTVRVIKTNLDNQAQDLYSTVVGVES